MGSTSEGTESRIVNLVLYPLAVRYFSKGSSSMCITALRRARIVLIFALVLVRGAKLKSFLRIDLRLGCSAPSGSDGDHRLDPPHPRAAPATCPRLWATIPQPTHRPKPRSPR